MNTHGSQFILPIHLSHPCHQWLKQFLLSVLLAVETGPFRPLATLRPLTHPKTIRVAPRPFAVPSRRLEYPFAHAPTRSDTPQTNLPADHPFIHQSINPTSKGLPHAPARSRTPKKKKIMPNLFASFSPRKPRQACATQNTTGDTPARHDTPRHAPTRRPSHRPLNSAFFGASYVPTLTP